MKVIHSLNTTQIKYIVKYLLTGSILKVWYNVINMERPQAEFPLMDEYKKHFEITPDTIFALYPYIYTNHKLTPDLLIHEQTHHKQQEWIGIKEWVKRYLENPKDRLDYEIEAYRNQIRYFKDRNQANKCRIWASEVLSSSLYGNIISKEEAWKILK